VTVASLSVRISSSDEEIGGARAALLARVGRLDAIVDNASINGVWAPIDDLMPNEWDRIVRVNLRGTYLTLAFALSPHPVRLLYSATKGAQVAMAQQLALELGRHSIRSTFFVRARSLPKYSLDAIARMWRSPSCVRKVALLSRKASQEQR
jgi:NAD(P)-dependent dehydrogenase (short-subunit alcohol dehydrogenase family)